MNSVLPTHGQVRPITELIEHTGYVYAPKQISDWRDGEAMCQKA